MIVFFLELIKYRLKLIKRRDQNNNTLVPRPGKLPVPFFGLQCIKVENVRLAC